MRTIQERRELTRRMRAYAILVAIELLHLPQAEHTALQVAAPQQEAPNVRSVPMEGIARSGRESSAPMVVVKSRAFLWWW